MATAFTPSPPFCFSPRARQRHRIPLLADRSASSTSRIPSGNNERAAHAPSSLCPPLRVPCSRRARSANPLSHLRLRHRALLSFKDGTCRTMPFTVRVRRRSCQRTQHRRSSSLVKLGHMRSRSHVLVIGIGVSSPSVPARPSSSMTRMPKPI